ncbi:MAG: EscU/YscU/HrcU family type III secretion system export apparatus switch protein, partial [Rhodocyclaceae bacterium]|nr:EscU/YscU/HrcU family type III secretion system export apparatus switch protein [Rhodocyclaceae bacterium]
APVVVAKGLGDVALRIRELAAEHGVPLLEAPPLARALYAHCELDPYTSGHGMPADEDEPDADDGAGQYAARELA